LGEKINGKKFKFCSGVVKSVVGAREVEEGTRGILKPKE